MTQVALTVPDAIDPDEVIFDEDGGVESMVDDETGEVIKADPKPESARVPHGPSDVNPDLDADEPSAPQTAGRGGAAKSLAQAERDLLADTLSVYGLDDDQIEWNGEQVRVSELSADERREFLTELRDRDRQEASGLNEAELELIDFVRSGGNLAEAFGGQAAGAPSQIAGLDTDALNRLDIRQQFPDLTDEEVEGELEDRKAGKLYDKKTDALRSRLTEAESQQQQRVAQQEFQQQRQQFTTAAGSLQEVLGFPVNDAIRQHLLEQTASQEANGNSPFLNSLTPEKILRLQFLDTFAQQMQQHYEQRSKDEYKRGRTEALSGAPARPSGRSGSAGASGGNGQRTGDATRRDTTNDSEYTLGAD